MIAPVPTPSRAESPWADVPDDTFFTWGWQLKNRITTPDALKDILPLTKEEKDGFAQTQGLFRFGVTPYYALLAQKNDPNCPIRRQIAPHSKEATIKIGERADPLGEEPREVVPNLIHRYPDRVLLLATDRCPVYCRFCTRRRIVGRIERQATRQLLTEAFAYIEATPGIREVIVSGGDALMLSDTQIDFILRRLRDIPHVDVIRIATRMPVTCPMRVTPELVEILSRYPPVYVMTHFNHPRECTETAVKACTRLVERGIVVYNQSVLLRGINDNISTIADLNRRLVSMRATPYYLHQCDLAEGIEHFRTPLSTGLEIIDGLRGHHSGLMVPQLCVDVPGGLGKVTLVPEWIVARNGRRTTFRTYTQEQADYWDPADDQAVDH